MGRPRCYDCLYYMRINRECRRNAPLPAHNIPLTMDGVANAVWPCVPSDAWCGEWSKRSPAQDSPETCSVCGREYVKGFVHFCPSVVVDGRHFSPRGYTK